jgi:hypothetical protein
LDAHSDAISTPKSLQNSKNMISSRVDAIALLNKWKSFANSIRVIFSGIGEYTTFTALGVVAEVITPAAGTTEGSFEIVGSDFSIIFSLADVGFGELSDASAGPALEGKAWELERQGIPLLLVTLTSGDLVFLYEVPAAPMRVQ